MAARKPPKKTPTKSTYKPTGNKAGRKPKGAVCKDMALLPDYIKETKDLSTARKLYAQHLLCQGLPAFEVAHLVSKAFQCTPVAASHVIEELKLDWKKAFANRDLDSKHEELEHRVMVGIRASLDTTNLTAYAKMLSLLKDLYGISSNTSVKIQAPTADMFFGSSFTENRNDEE